MVPARDDEMWCIALCVLKLTSGVIRDALITCDRERWKIETIEAIVKLLPSEEELRSLSKERKQVEATSITWGDAEVFLFEVGTSIPDVSERVDIWAFMNEFTSNFKIAMDSLLKMDEAMACLMHKKSKFKEVLSLILAIGNFMNQGTAHGNASGFAIENLTTLNSVKAQDGKTSLLEILVRQIVEKRPHLLAFSDELQPLQKVQVQSLSQWERGSTRSAVSWKIAASGATRKLFARHSCGWAACMVANVSD